LFNRVSWISANLLSIIYRLLPLSRGRNPNLFQEVINEAQKLKDELTQMTEDAAENLSAIEQLQSKADGSFHIVANSGANADQILGVLNEQKQTAEQTLDAIEVNHSSSTALFDKIKTFSEDVEKFQPKFVLFQSKMESAIQDLTENNSSANNLIEKLHATVAMLDQIETKSTEILGFATVTGLASSYRAEIVGIDNRLRWSGRLFYVSLALFAFSVCVALGILPWLESNGILSIIRFQTPADASPLTLFDQYDFWTFRSRIDCTAFRYTCRV
jgi:hypothetical protein